MIEYYKYALKEVKECLEDDNSYLDEYSQNDLKVAENEIRLLIEDKILSNKIAYTTSDILDALNPNYY